MGMEAADVLPRDIARDNDAARQFESTEHGIGDPHVCLVRGEDIQVLGRTPAASNASAAVFAIV